MSSPFHIFHRNKKLMLAALTLMAMIAFVFSPLLQPFGSGGGGVDPVIAETSFGKLKASDLHRMEESRRIVAEFLQRVVMAKWQKQADEKQKDLRSQDLIQYYAQIDASRLVNEVMMRTSQGQEAAAVETMLLNHRAEQLNMVVSDAAINQFLRMISEDSLPPSQMSRIIESMRQGAGGVREAQLFEALRTELTAWEVRKTFDASLDGIPPAERWDFYRRLDQKAKVQAIAVQVEDFVDKVQTPDDAVLLAFFDEHKNKFASPDSPEPGFKQPRREKFEYFVAEPDLLQQVAEVSDDEVKKYYDENKKTMFRKLELPKDKPADTEPAPADDAEAKPKASEAEPSPDDADSKPKDEKPADSIESDFPEPTDEKPAEEPKKEGSVQRQNTRRGGVQFRLVAEEKAAEEKPAEEQPAAAPAEEKSDAPADPAKAEDKPAEESKSESTPPAEAPLSKEEKEEYDPLEKVRDQIVRNLKVEKANKKITAAIDELSGLIRSYSGARTLYELNKEKDRGAVAPKELDYVALAKKHGLGFEETKLVSINDLVDSEKHRAFASTAFGKNHPKYATSVAQDQAGNTYLVWKTEEVDEYTPTFKEARDEVLHTWKMIKARDIARKQAETYASEAKGAGKPLAEVFVNKPKVIEAGPFTWLSMGSTPEDGRPSMPTISEVPGIERPGEDFMRTVFNLAAHETGVASNQTQEIFYTVQPISFEPETADLERDFANSDFRRYVVIAQIERNRLRKAWVESLERAASLKWLRAPAADNEA